LLWRLVGVVTLAVHVAGIAYSKVDTGRFRTIQVCPKERSAEG